MQSLTIKKIIQFRDSSEKRRNTFINEIKSDKEKTKKGGGDHWSTAICTISDAYKKNDLSILHNKIEKVKEWLEEDDLYSVTRGMYQNNLNVLELYERFDFSVWKPDKKVSFLNISGNLILGIKGFEIKLRQQHIDIFSFSKEGKKQIGAIWFIAQKDGFRKHDIAMFTDALYRYLKLNYSEEYILNPDYIFAVDIVGEKKVTYSQLKKGSVFSGLTDIINDIEKML